MIAYDMVSIGTPFHYGELETAFQHGTDLLEASNGADMEKDIFDQLELTVDDFSNNYVVKSIADLVCTDELEISARTAAVICNVYDSYMHTSSESRSQG